MNQNNNDWFSKTSEYIKQNQVKVVLGEDAHLPKLATSGSAGYDLKAAQNCIVDPGMQLLVPTNLKVQLPENIAMLIIPRSGLAAKHCVTVLNTPGCVDSDFRGIVQVILVNHGYLPFFVQKGDRIAQAIFIQVRHPELIVVDELEQSDRNSGGFGSTGVK